jgi:general nucleoside transport system permease protein
MRERILAASHSSAFTALAIVTALALSGLVIIFSNPDTLGEWNDFFSDPGGALSSSWNVVYDSFYALFDTSLNGVGPISRTLVEATPLLFAGLAVALAFRAGLFNIGGAGQLMMGATAAAFVGLKVDLPTALHLPLVLAAAFAGGMVWGGIAGFLKAKTGAHEVISTIMLNFIALELLDYLLGLETFQRPQRDDLLTPPMPDSARLPELPGPFDVHAGLLLGIGAAVGVWWLLERSTIGFRMRAVGINPEAARAAGMSVAATYLLSMALAGGLAGMAGASNLLGRQSYSLTGGFYADLGFDAIALALVGRAKPGGVVAAALLFGALKAGSTGMQIATETPVDIIVVIQALVIAFVAAPSIVSAIWRMKAGRGALAQQFSAGWGAA